MGQVIYVDFKNKKLVSTESVIDNSSHPTLNIVERKMAQFKAKKEMEKKRKISGR